MPLINGACVPPVCFNRTLLAAGAKLMLYATVGGAPMPPRDVTDGYPALLQQGITALNNARNLACDGCSCLIIRRFNPGLNIALDFTVLENSETDANGVVTVRKYVVTGTTYVLSSIGICLPPGTKVKVSNKWVPVEEAGEIGSGSSFGGGKKKKKVKKKATRKTRGKGGRTQKTRR